MYCEGGQMSGGMYCERGRGQGGCIVSEAEVRRDVL